jgi:hypothetical protein
MNNQFWLKSLFVFLVGVQHSETNASHIESTHCEGDFDWVRHLELWSICFSAALPLRGIHLLRHHLRGVTDIKRFFLYLGKFVTWLFWRRNSERINRNRSKLVPCAKWVANRIHKGGARHMTVWRKRAAKRFPGFTRLRCRLFLILQVL